VTIKTVIREETQELPLLPRVYVQAPKDLDLIGLVGYSKTSFQSHFVAKFPEERGAKCVDRSTLHSIGARAKVLETRRDFLCCPVGEGERKDVSWIEVPLFYKEANTLDEAESLSRTRTSENEHRAEVSLYRCSLRWGGDVRRKDANAGGDNRLGAHL
jgi:hypothetical protein